MAFRVRVLTVVWPVAIPKTRTTAPFSTRCAVAIATAAGSDVMAVGALLEKRANAEESAVAKTLEMLVTADDDSAPHRGGHGRRRLFFPWPGVSFLTHLLFDS